MSFQVCHNAFEVVISPAKLNDLKASDPTAPTNLKTDEAFVRMPRLCSGGRNQ